MNKQLPKKGHTYLKQVANEGGPCATVSLECDGGGKRSQQHREKLMRAIDRLAESSDGTPASEKVISKLKALSTDRELWSGEYNGVCIHVSERLTRFLKLPYPPVEKARLEDSFCVRPAADTIAALSEWLALDISLKRPRLFRFNGEVAKEMEGVDLPSGVQSFSEAGVLDGGQNSHVRRTHGGGSPHLVTHGTHESKSPRELNETIFMREVAHVMSALPESKELPLVVIGDKRVVAEFLDTYQHAGEAVVKVCNAEAHPDERKVTEICKGIAWEEQQRRKYQVLDTIEEMRSRNGVFSNNVREVFEAARQGRVSAAVLACDDDIWCRMGEDERPRSADPADEDAFEALDRIYLETLLKDGDAIVLPEEEIPGGTSVAAVFKW